MDSMFFYTFESLNKQIREFAMTLHSWCAKRAFITIEAKIRLVGAGKGLAAASCLAVTKILGH